MAQAILEQVISQLDTLRDEELDQLERAVRQRRAETVPVNQQAEFHRVLLASGLVKRIARRTEPDTSERPLIEAQGEPVSETILRERR